MRVAKMTTIAVISFFLLMALDSLGIGKASADEGGKAACAQFCAQVFGDTKAAGQCTSEAAHGTGLCDQCGPASNGSQVVCGTQCCSTTALDQCHLAGCDTSSDTCANSLAPNGTPCSDNNPLCINGACCGTGRQVVNGGCFAIPVPNSLFGACPATCTGQVSGNVVGSGNFLCFVNLGGACASNTDCPVGQACSLAAGACISPC